MYHHVNFVKRLRLLSLENQSDYHWFVLLHNCLNYNKLPSLFLESSCVYGLRSTDSNIYSVPKIMRTCSAGGFPYAALFLWENPPSQLEKQFCSRSASVRGHRVLFRPFWASSVGAEAVPGFPEKSEFVVLLGALGNGALLWALSPWSQAEAWGNCTKFHPPASPAFNVILRGAACFTGSCYLGYGSSQEICGPVQSRFRPLRLRQAQVCTCICVVSGLVLLMWGSEQKLFLAGKEASVTWTPLLLFRSTAPVWEHSRHCQTGAGVCKPMFNAVFVFRCFRRQGLSLLLLKP